jgi:hypothetical protein
MGKSVITTDRKMACPKACYGDKNEVTSFNNPWVVSVIMLIINYLNSIYIETINMFYRLVF